MADLAKSDLTSSQLGTGKSLVYGKRVSIVATAAMNKR